MTLLSCCDLVVGYDRQPVLGPLSFSVQAGDLVCIVGENGAGKSTLIRTLLRLQPPLSGTIALGGGICAKDIGYLPQQTRVQKDFPATVREIVLSGCENRKGLRPFYNRQEKAAALQAMERMGIRPLERACYRELSGGQQQRVLLARALCAANKLLLLDEPTAGLDPHATAELYDLMTELNRDGMTLLVITHDLHAAMERASHILHIGSPIFFGTAADYAASPSGFVSGEVRR